MLKPMLSRWLMLPAFLMLLVWAMPRAHAGDDFLEPEQAFKFSAKMVDAKTAEVNYVIADGYYMYREHFKFRVEGAKLGTVAYPKGVVHFDDTFQKNVETYRNTVTIRLPVDAKGAFTLIAVGQGCAEKGLCYPPQESRVTLTPPAGSAPKATSDVQTPPAQGGGTPQTADIGVAPTSNTAVMAQPQATAATQTLAAPALAAAPTVQKAKSQQGSLFDSDSNVLEDQLKSRSLIFLIPLFFLLGLGLSLTPCVFPMLPILTSIIVGEGANVTRKRGFTLSAIYSLGMALVYTAAGVITALLSENVAASFQDPRVLIGFGLVIAVLALSMFDVYQLQMPASIQSKLTQISGKQQGGKLAGVFVMGALSGLIIGPCVTAPLIAVLLFISKTHDPVFGGGMLFIMALGMSTPLMLIGVSAGWLLPKAGMWMDAIKRFFGVILLGVALWLAGPAIPAKASYSLWSILLCAYAAYLLFGKQLSRTANAFGLLFALCGSAAVIATAHEFSWLGQGAGAASTSRPADAAEAKTAFVRIKSAAELDDILAKEHKTVMLDFYADWCVSCKEMEKLTFTDPEVKQKFSDMVLLQADVTANDEEDKALLKRFNLYGPPGIIFFDKDGREINGGRVVGYQKPQKFASSLDLALHHSA